jgi:hypothetical protein
MKGIAWKRSSAPRNPFIRPHYVTCSEQRKSKFARRNAAQRHPDRKSKPGFGSIKELTPMKKEQLEVPQTLLPKFDHLGTGVSRSSPTTLQFSR